ncbi:MAG: hypothetical protein SGPRY_012811 [Prymnesium sp.]
MRPWAPLLVPLAMARAAEASEQGTFEQMSAQMFSHLDADNDGFLAFADVKPLLQSPPARAKGIVPGEFFKSLDVNGDGKLSMAEAKGFFIETYVESAGIMKERHEKAELEQFRHLMQARTYIPRPLVSVCFSFKWLTEEPKLGEEEGANTRDCCRGPLLSTLVRNCALPR